VAKRHTTAKVSEETNMNLPAKNTLVQLLVLYTDPESCTTFQADIRADGPHDDANRRSYCV